FFPSRAAAAMAVATFPPPWKNTSFAPVAPSLSGMRLTFITISYMGTPIPTTSISLTSLSRRQHIPVQPAAEPQAASLQAESVRIDPPDPSPHKFDHLFARFLIMIQDKAVLS